MASTVWKGYVTFGLISIPIRLFAAARTERVSFHEIHQVCNTRIKQQLYCPHCERTVQRSEIVKGYEIGKDEWVIVDDEEIAKIAPASTETMEIQEFVKIADIDPLYFDTSYYAVPEDPGRKAYQLLVETMEKSGYAAIAKVGMHRREHIVVIRPRDNGLTLHTIYYPNEVRAVPGYGKAGAAEVNPREIQMAEKIIESLAGPFEPNRYQDAYQKRLTDLIEAKSKGKELRQTPHKKAAPVVDLMEALQKSLANVAKKPAAQETRKIHVVKPRKTARKAAHG